MNAYELAEFIETGGENIDRKELANMLRQQADRIAELEKQCAKYEELIANWDTLQTKQTPDGLIDPKSYYIGYADGKKAPQTKPLSEKELYEVFDKCYPNNGDGDVVTLVDFARAIEERHGIK